MITHLWLHLSSHLVLSLHEFQVCLILMHFNVMFFYIIMNIFSCLICFNPRGHDDIWTKVFGLLHWNFSSSHNWLKSYTTKECLFCNYVVHSPLSSTINLFHLHTKCHHVLFVPHTVCHNLKIVPSLPHPIHTIDIISSSITLSLHHHHATTLSQHQ
jgi:hypothetical protein